MTGQAIHLTVNGKDYNLEVKAGGTTLLDILRDELDLTGAKRGCDRGECGTCTVVIDGRPVRSCLTLAVLADGRDIVTIEGLEKENGRLDPLQESFIEHGAIQCGFCTPGMILSGKALLEENPDPSEAEVRRSISGNLCRCTGYSKIVEAIMKVPKGKTGSDPAPKSTEPGGRVVG
jgi:carbon-monoxide dehydrogenase small subunit